jgi:hypothetical protein
MSTSDGVNDPSRYRFVFAESEAILPVVEINVTDDPHVFEFVGRLRTSEDGSSITVDNNEPAALFWDRTLVARRERRGLPDLITASNGGTLHMTWNVIYGEGGCQQDAGLAGT